MGSLSYQESPAQTGETRPVTKAEWESGGFCLQDAAWVGKAEWSRQQRWDLALLR